jgi:hypothetical protein
MKLFSFIMLFAFILPVFSNENDIDAKNTIEVKKIGQTSEKINKTKQYLKIAGIILEGLLQLPAYYTVCIDIIFHF